jgi:acetylglutamate/LysW-gamma-L-alpha-aminoadipate kinase
MGANMENNRLIVIKIGGARDIQLRPICEDIAAMIAQGQRIVLVHGGSERANQLANEMGHPPQYLRSPSNFVSRYTDAAMRDIFVDAVTSFNSDICRELNGFGVQTLSLGTTEACVLRGERKSAIRAVIDGRIRVIHDDYSGSLIGVDRDRIQSILDQGMVPVIPPLAYSETDGYLNVNGDRAAAAVSAALAADMLLMLSNVVGLYRDCEDQSSLVHVVPRGQLDTAMSWADGQMKHKVLSVREALENGVAQAAIIDGRRPQPLQAALAGGGTWFA